MCQCKSHAHAITVDACGELQVPAGASDVSEDNNLLGCQLVKIPVSGNFVVPGLNEIQDLEYVATGYGQIE